MELSQLFTICGASSPDDWNVVHGPTFVTGFVQIWNGPASDQSGYELHPLEHEARAAFKPDLAIGIAWGMHTDALTGIGTERRTFNEEWATSFPDPEATQHFVDFFFEGALVARERYVHVDSRCDLPMPKRKIEGEGADAKIVELSITPWQRDFFRVLNALQTSVNYDSYISRAGFEIRDSAE